QVRSIGLQLVFDIPKNTGAGLTRDTGIDDPNDSPLARFGEQPLQDIRISLVGGNPLTEGGRLTDREDPKFSRTLLQSWPSEMLWNQPKEPRNAKSDLQKNQQEHQIPALD